MKTSTLLLGISVIVLGGCSSVGGGSTNPPQPETRYALALDDWHGDFLHRPVTRSDCRLPHAGLLVPWVLRRSTDFRENQVRVFRLADDHEVPGTMQPGNVTIDGRVLSAEPFEGELDRRWVAQEPLLDGWYLAAFDARQYRPEGMLYLLPWGHAVDDVAYARFRIGDGIDWVSTVTGVDDLGRLSVSVGLSSSIATERLGHTRITVERNGEPAACEDAGTGMDVEVPGFGVWCPEFALGDTFRVTLTSDVIGHPSGVLAPHEFVLDVPFAQHPVAPGLGLSTLRAAYGLEGSGT